MLAIRLKRTGRSGHAQFRVVVQDSRFSPTSGRIVSYLGSYDPHTKVSTLDKEKAVAYLSDGAQPSPRVVKILEKEGVKLPSWVKPATQNKRAIRNPDKLRRNRPAGVPAPVVAEESEAAAAEPAAQIESPVEAPVEAAAETPSAEASTEETPTEETPTTEAPTEEAPAVEPEAEPVVDEAKEEPATEPAETPAEPETPAETEEPKPEA